MFTVCIVGFGSRGQNFAVHLNNTDNAKLVAIAEINEINRKALKRKYNKNDCLVFNSADEFFAKGKMSDAVIISTQDKEHAEMTLKALDLGYDVLLEKPAATSIEDCIAIRDKADALGRKVMLTHVLRYAPFYACAKKIIKDGTLGQIVNIDQTENIAHWHFALSYVRGPWRKMEDSTPTLLAKCCHDLDLIKWFMDKKCTAVSSFGGLYHFKEENAPKGSAKYCADCKEETRKNCVYNAYAVYKDRLEHPVVGGLARLKGQDPNKIIDAKQDVISKCVYHSENDAVDNQVVNMLFEDGSTAHLTMTAFSYDCYRLLHVYGTKGEMFGNLDEDTINVHVFGQGKKAINVNEIFNKDGVVLSGGHGGGDYYLLKDFIDYVTLNTPSITRTTIHDSIESHIIGYKAEESRLNGGKSIKI